jgi:hypothetical protein
LVEPTLAVAVDHEAVLAELAVVVKAVFSLTEVQVQITLVAVEAVDF